MREKVGEKKKGLPRGCFGFFNGAADGDAFLERVSWAAVTRRKLMQKMCVL